MVKKKDSEYLSKTSIKVPNKQKIGHKKKGSPIKTVRFVKWKDSKDNDIVKFIWDSNILINKSNLSFLKARHLSPIIYFFKY